MEEKRLEIMNKVNTGEYSIATAAAKLGRSKKTIRRYKKELLQNPNATLAHKNLGRKPVNKTDHEKIWKLYLEKYYGYNILFFCEKLEKNEGIKISEGLVRLIFKEHDEFSVRAWHKTKNELRKRLPGSINLQSNKRKSSYSLRQNPMFVQPTQHSPEANILERNFRWMQASTYGLAVQKPISIQR